MPIKGLINDDDNDDVVDSIGRRAKMTTRTAIALSVGLNAILLTAVFHQAFLVSRDVACSSATAKSDSQCPTVESQSVILSTEESMYVMYGEGDDFTDTNEHLLSYIRSMTSRQGPGGRHLSRYLTDADYSQSGGARLVDELLKRRRNGFFVECGAFGGEDLSDTLFFELQRNWTGILIEANPEYHRSILTKNRRALVLRACLNPHPGLLKFSLDGWAGGVTALYRNNRDGQRKVPETDVQCFTLNSIMAAIGVRHIDFMVLDVEGSELPVLETIDFARLTIDVFSIEYRDDDPIVKLEKIRKFFNRTGNYKEVGILPWGQHAYIAQDVLFMRE